MEANAVLSKVLQVLHTTPDLISGITPNPETNAHYSGVELEKMIEEIFKGDISYYNNKGHSPPDLMTRNDPESDQSGYAIEVKKVELGAMEISLNSSPPRAVLSIDNSKISRRCKECEEWTEKPMIYIVGEVSRKDGWLTRLWVVDAATYAANEDTYHSLFNGLQKSLQNEGELNGNVKSKPTKEFARIVDIDPLNRTDLRARPMFSMSSPLSCFKKWVNFDDSKDFHLIYVVSNDTYKHIEPYVSSVSDATVTSVNLPDPNDAYGSIDSKIILLELS